MVVVRAHEASSSACYDVFLSFRGEGTRKTFIDHLYTALVQQGFSTFRDDDEIERGENLMLELEKAISQSKISIVVISKDYASSTWCLDELLLILEQRKIYGHVVLPVFYHVDPSQVQKQTGRIAEAFARYEKQFEAETNSEGKIKLMEKIKGWRSALTEVANLIGLDLRNQADGWRFGNQLEAGDEITLTFDGDEYEAEERGFKLWSTHIMIFQHTPVEHRRVLPQQPV